MLRISLNLGSDLEVKDNKLKIKISDEPDNTLTIEDDGLFALAKPGQEGSNGTGYPSQDADGIRIGYTNIFNNDKTASTSENGTLCHLTNVVHRFFKLEAPYNGETTPNSKQYQAGNHDIILCGDMMYYDDPETNTRDVWMITKVRYNDNVFSGGVINQDEIHDTEIVSVVKLLTGVSI